MVDMSAADITPAGYLILLVLAAGPAHGYAIMQEVAAMTAGTAQLGPGTLYRTIQKLLDERWIDAIGTDADERRVPYRITRSGTAVARTELARLARLVRLGEKRLAARTGRGAHP